MAKRLTGNGAWEASRMIMPEHKQEIFKQDKGINKLVKPELDKQEITMINQALYASMHQKRVVTLTVFAEWGAQDD